MLIHCRPPLRFIFNLLVLLLIQAPCLGDNEPCLQQCQAARKECGHPCAAMCHPGKECPTLPCKARVGCGGGGDMQQIKPVGMLKHLYESACRTVSYIKSNEIN